MSYNHVNQNRQSNTGYQSRNETALQELLKMPEKGFIKKDTYVDDAMNCFNNIKSSITLSKLRSLYSMLCDIITNESNNHNTKISSDCLADLKLLRVHMIYDMGRDNKVKEFMEKTHLVAYLVYVEKNDSRENFEIFCKYFEALVAFHRYLNPREN